MDTTLNSFPSPLSSCQPALPVINPLYPSLPTAIGLPSNFDIAWAFRDPAIEDVADCDALLYALDDDQAPAELLGHVSTSRFRVELASHQRIILGQGTYSQCKTLCRLWRLNKPTRRTLILIPKPQTNAVAHWL